MPARIVVQPNGLFARFSTVVDDFTDIDMTREEALDLTCEEKVIAAILSPGRFDEAIDTIRTIHGDAEAQKAIASLDGGLDTSHYWIAED